MLKRELEKLIEAAWKAERDGELWKESAIDLGYIEGQKRLAKHNFEVAQRMNALNKAIRPLKEWEKCPDWVITACYYSMHRAVLAWLAGKGWKGRGHEPTLGNLIEILGEAQPALAEEIGNTVNEARKLRNSASYAVFSFEELQQKVDLLLADTATILKKLGVV